MVKYLVEQDKQKLRDTKITNFTPIATINKDLNTDKTKNKIKVLVKEEVQEAA